MSLLTETERNTRITGITRKLECILGDGAYDCNEDYHLAKQFGTKFIVPPPKNATLHYKVRKHGTLIDEDPDWKDGNEVVRRIKYQGGLEK